MAMPTTQEPPREAVRRWAVVLAVPAAAFVIGAVALPRPVPIGSTRSGASDRDLAGVVSRVTPQPRSKVDAVLGNAVRLHGADLPGAAVAGGDPLALRFYFESLAGLDQDWQVFLHIDAKQGSYRIHGDHFPARGRYSTTLWQKGEVITDQWTGTVPRGAPAGAYDVWIGFYIGDDRLPFSGGDDAVHDGVDRVRVGTIQVK
ncbi:MAG: hypothetical protein A2138_12980 [Deltaproteobacteria bacterium RBG_16_71_12]|nr:MAG: hypothetical protein A2138_12980 [Deltaproteobacteria bacterium RBG_16_71_12]